jgi:hypothetical protein
MKFVPDAVSRMTAGQLLSVQKHSPTILLGVGVVSMVGSTILACRATLKMEEVLNEIEGEKHQQQRVKKLVDEGEAPEGTTYSDEEAKQDQTVIKIRGIAKVVKLYAPAVILGGIGVVCLTKSHKILSDRNTALTAAYVALDGAFRAYRDRVVDRYGEETDRDLRYDYEEVDVIDEETGKVAPMLQAAPGEPSGYARWFDGESSECWTAPPFENHNWVFLRNNQNWANDILRSRGHIFLNEVYKMLGLSHTSAGAVVGWVYDRNNEHGDNYIDFGVFEHDSSPLYSNGRDGAILLDFNVDGVIYDLIDERNARNTAR